MSSPLELESLQRLFAAMSLTSFDIRAEFYALATHIETPDNFYVAPVPFIRRLDTLYRTRGQCNMKDLYPKKVVIYRSQVLGHNIRGSVEKINDRTCTIFAIDYGMMEDNIVMRNIYHPALQEAVTTPSQVQQCKLDLCIPREKEFSQHAIESFKQLMGKIRGERLKVIIKAKRDRKLIVTVYNSSFEQISFRMAFMGCSYMYPTNRVHRPRERESAEQNQRI